MNRSTAFVLAIDPGSQHVGWAYGQGTKLIESGIDEPVKFLHNLEEMLDVDGSFDRLVIERFDPRQWTDDSFRTVKLIGAIEWIATVYGMDIAEVNAADKKKFIEGIPSKVTSHARDAEAVRLWDLVYGRW